MHPESLQLLRDVDAAQTRLKSTIKEAQKWLSASDELTDPVRAVASFLRVLDQVAVLYSINYFRLGIHVILSAISDQATVLSRRSLMVPPL